jgi:cytosine/uracil/thiamine/allantoin permease
VALVALALSIAPSVPGFLAAIGLLGKAAVWPWLLVLHNYAWFMGFFVAAAVYLLLMRGRPLAGPTAYDAVGSGPRNASMPATGGSFTGRPSRADW